MLKLLSTFDYNIRVIILFQISYLISKESKEGKKAAEATTKTSLKAGAGAAASVIPVQL